MTHFPAPDLIGRLRERRAELEQEALSSIEAVYPAMAETLHGVMARTVLTQTTDLLIATLEFGEGHTRGAIDRLAADVGARAADASVPIEQVSGTLRLYQRVAWEICTGIALQLDLDAVAMTALAVGAVGFSDRFTHMMVDAWAAAVAREQEALGGARQSLLTTLLGGHPQPTDLAERARGCGWPLPEKARVAVRGDASVIWPRDALVGRWGQHEVAILTRSEPIGSTWSTGPSVPPSALAQSLHGGLRLAALAGASFPRRWDDHLSDLVLTGDPSAANDFTRRVLAPLASAPPRQRAWLYDTLRAWIDEQGSPGRVAERLSLHPQSARYRISRLKEVMGAPLDDPAGRLDFAMALRLRELGHDASAPSQPRVLG